MLKNSVRSTSISLRLYRLVTVSVRSARSLRSSRLSRPSANKRFWKGVYSSSSPVQTCIKQDAVISPALFCCYVDKLLFNLETNGIGCSSGKIFIGGLAHADDIVLIAPTSRAMRRTLFSLLVYSFAITNFSNVFISKKSVFNIRTYS